MAKNKNGGGSLSEILDPARALVEQNKQIYIDRHAYRPADAADFAKLDGVWYEAASKQLAAIGFVHLGDIVNVTIEKAGVRTVLRRFIAKDALTMAVAYQFVHGKTDLRIFEFESELTDATFLVTSNAEASKAVTMPPQIASIKYTAATPVDELWSLHRVAQRKLLKAKAGVDFVAIRTADEYQAAQHRQEAIKAAFRAGINYLDPAEVRRIAEQKRPDDPAGAAIAGVVADIARRPPSLLETMMNAKDGGAGPEAIGKAFAERLTQGKDALPANKTQEIADAMAGLFKSAESGDSKAGFAGLLGLLGKLDAMEPPEQKEARKKKAAIDWERIKADGEKRQQKHREKRLAKGLIAEAGTGELEPEVRLYALPRPELDYKDKPRSLTAHVNAINSAKRARDQKTTDALPIGASRLGGVPDLPPGVAWPEVGGKKIPFIAQIDLATFKPKKKGLLPARGHLYAFALISNEKKHWPPPVAVFVSDAATKSLVRATLDDDAKLWPDWCGENVYEVLPATPKKSAAPDSGRRADGASPMAFLGGEIGAFGTPGELADSAMLDGDDWINLLAVHSVGSMQWSDCGDLYFLIRRSALQRGDFAGIYAIACSS